jgi:hypothetical protein
MATIGADIYPLTFETDFGPICFNVWDATGQSSPRRTFQGCHFSPQANKPPAAFPTAF